ncbi:MAG: hypothetical protein KME09_19430 [Pleurocapsa minor HA4230-MV1]|nr:hypothetical protein [Pleurocapsa minor HA4230-MV1]
MADEICGVEKPKTTTGNMDEINYSIRKYNAPTNDIGPYTVETVGNEIRNNSVATKAYQRINDQGYDVRINYDRPPEPETVARTQRDVKNVEVYAQNNYSTEDVVGTIVHESTHVEYRHKKRIPYNTQYEEYRAAVRERIYRNSKNPYRQTRPTLEERRRIWEDVKRDYSYLQQGKNPFGGGGE